MEYRTEQDSMGTIQVPQNAYYGPQTQRAVDNFPISGLTFHTVFIHALAHIKEHAATVNSELKLLENPFASAITRAAREVRAGKWEKQFVVDIFQTGSGTSTNMNMNEVLAKRANEISTGKPLGQSPIHPNDHVNMGQSSNDVIPSALHMAAAGLIQSSLIPALKHLKEALVVKADAFSDIPKIGRTHLQDAVPIFLGQEFSGYARQIQLAIARAKSVMKGLMELALGGTAVGNGLNTHPDFAKKVIHRIAGDTHFPFIEAVNHFEAQSAQDAAVETSGALKTIAVSLMKMANDIRWLASGPRCGLSEINLPPLQPGSSIMPGKVNPVIPEAVIQVAMQVVGNDTAITMAGQSGYFELNTALPLMAYNLIQSITLLSSVIDVFTRKCVTGITANRDKCASNIEKSLALATALVPHIGYDKAAVIAKKAHEQGKTIREVAKEEHILPDDLLNRLLPPEQ